MPWRSFLATPFAVAARKISDSNFQTEFAR
jgi:hypothetical protein